MDRPAEERGGICSRCGGEVAPEADVCPHCGAVLRPVEEVLPPAEEPEETVPDATAPADAVEEAAQEAPAAKGRRRLTGKAKVLIAAAAAAAVALTAVTVVLVRRSSQDTRTPLLFYKDSTLYAVSPVNWNRIIALPAENGDAYLNSAYIQYSRDGRYLYYPDSAGMDSYTLYCCDLFRGSTRMVDDEVVGLYRLTPDGRTAVYCSGEELLCSDPDGKRILAQDVQRFMLAVDGRTVVYQTADRTLYRGSLPSGESTQIGGADDVHYISPEADSAYYVRDYVLYYWKNGGQEQRLREVEYGVDVIGFGGREAYLLFQEVPDSVLSVVQTGEEASGDPRYQLYYCRDGESRLLAEDVRQFQTVSGADETARLLYRVQKTADGVSAWYYAGGAESSLVTQEDEIGMACLSGNGRELWFIAGEVVPPPVTSSFRGLRTGTLRATQLHNGKIGAIRAVDDRAMMLVPRFRGEPLYLQDRSDVEGDGLRLTGALCHNGEVIAEEVQLFGVLPEPESDAVYFSLRADENGGFSTLMKWDGHTASVISEKTVRTELLGRDRVAVLSSDEQVLIVFDRGRAIELEREVSVFGIPYAADKCACWW